MLWTFLAVAGAWEAGIVAGPEVPDEVVQVLEDAVGAVGEVVPPERAPVVLRLGEVQPVAVPSLHLRLEDVDLSGVEAAAARLAPDAVVLLAPSEAEVQRWTALGRVTVVVGRTTGATATVPLEAVLGPIARDVALSLEALAAGEERPRSRVEGGAVPLAVAPDALAALGRSVPLEVLAESAGSGDNGATLEALLASAFANSPSLQASRAGLDAEEHARLRAWSTWLPEVEATGSGQVLQESVANAIQPAAQLDGKVTAKQLLWSDGAFTAVRIQDDLARGRSHERLGLEQEVAHQVVSAAIGVRRTEALLEVRRTDLHRVREVLALTRRRETLGDATSADVARWVSEEAGARRALVQTWNDRSTALHRLRQVTGWPLEEPLAVAPLELAEHPLGRLEDTEGLEAARRAVEAVAIERSPALAQLAEATSAQERARNLAARAPFMPTVAGQVSVNLPVWRAETDPLALPGMEPIQLMPSVGEPYWAVGGSVTVPLFSGGAHRADRLEARDKVRQLGHQRDALERAVSTDAVLALEAARTATVELALARQQVEAVRISLDSVSAAYAAGAVPQSQVTEVRAHAVSAEVLLADTEMLVQQRLADLQYALTGLSTPLLPAGPAEARAAVLTLLETP